MKSLTFLLAILLISLADAQEEKPKIKFGGSWRLRLETWDWFESHGTAAFINCEFNHSF